MKLTAKTFAGLEDLLRQEIEALGGENVTAGRRVVEFEGDQQCLYRVLYESRYALTVLRPIWSFTAKDEQEAYRKAFSCDWAKYIEIEQTFAISPTVYSDIFTHSQYISLKMKDAICDRFRKKYSRRPSIDTESPDIKLDLYVNQDKFVISLDAAGEALYKRGYRREGHPAPLNEVLAAGIVGLSKWDGTKPLVDGMCGTGTICLEAAMQHCNVPAQILRRNWACMRWMDFDFSLWKKIVQEAKDRIKSSPTMLYGSDIQRSYVFTSFRSADLLEVGETVEFEKKDFFKLEPPAEGSTLIMNPPYGERMGEDINEMYSDIGDRLKNHWKGSTAFLFTGNQTAAKNVGLRTSAKIILFNGPIECRLLKFEMY